MARHGIPDKLMSDNGPQYNSDEFRRFADRYEFEHVTSSPGYPQSNGKAENAVRTVQSIMQKALEAIPIPSWISAIPPQKEWIHHLHNGCLEGGRRPYSQPRADSSDQRQPQVPCSNYKQTRLNKPTTTTGTPKASNHSNKVTQYASNHTRGKRNGRRPQ